MTSIPNPAPLSAGITGPLARLRARIRGYVWLEGLALAFAWLGLAFWVTLLIDWAPVKFGSDEPSLPWRIVMIAIAILAFAGLVVWMVLRRSFTSLPVFAIGGIQIDQVNEVMQAGADGVAVISAILKVPDIGYAVKTFLAQM